MIRYDFNYKHPIDEDARHAVENGSHVEMEFVHTFDDEHVQVEIMPGMNFAKSSARLAPPCHDYDV